MQAIYEDYAVLQAIPVDDQGVPYPKRITGVDVVPNYEHDVIMAVEMAKLWKITPDEAVDSIGAAEFIRRVAIARASSWDQPTPSQIYKNRHERRLGIR